jgi:hypothetical protein
MSYLAEVNPGASFLPNFAPDTAYITQNREYTFLIKLHLQLSAEFKATYAKLKLE